MGRKAHGSLKRMLARQGEQHGHWALAIFVPKERRHLTGGRRRLWFHTLPAPDSPLERQRAAERAAALTEQVRTRPDDFVRELAKRAGKAREVPQEQDAEPSADQGETCDEWYRRYHRYRKTRQLSSPDDAAYRWGKWISPAIGRKPIAQVTREDIEDIRNRLDDALLEYQAHGRGEGRLAPKTAANIWSALTSAFSEAVSSKQRDLQVLQANPCANVLPPERGDARQRPWVYPREVLQLAACKDVPREWREIHVVACYLYVRPNELRELRWGDVDLVNAVVHVSRSWNMQRKRVEAPKTRNGRRVVPIDAALLPLLSRMGGGKQRDELVAPLLSCTNENTFALITREHLKAAGVTRPRLYESGPTTLPVDFRAWRDTGITWLALAGVDVVKIQRRAGHDNVQTTIGYVKAAEDLGGGVGTPFPPLPEALTGGTVTAPKSPDEGPARDDEPSVTSSQPERMINALAAPSASLDELAVTRVAEEAREQAKTGGFQVPSLALKSSRVRKSLILLSVA